MSLIRKILDRLTSRRELERIAAEARRATKLSTELSDKTDNVRTQVAELQRSVTRLERQLGERLLQYNLQLGRLSRAVDGPGENGHASETLGTRMVPMHADDLEFESWQSVGGGITHPDSEGREWIILDACPLCGAGEGTLVNPWNKLLLLERAPDDASARYDYTMCHACGVVSARRRPFGARYRFLLEHFGEVTAKRAKRGDGREIPNPVLNPYPLSAEEREELKRLVRRGIFVSDHLGLRSREYLASLLRDRFDNSGHADLLGSLVPLRNARVLEVRSRTGSILDALRQHWGAAVYAMPIWESQRVIVEELYGIPASELIDFDRFRIPFDGLFDLIICQHMVTHVVRPAEFFAELRAHLKPDGYLYLHNEPDDREFLSANQSILATLNPLHMQAFDQESLVRGLAANGFETVFVKEHDLSHLCLARRNDVTMVPMDDRQRKQRVESYEQAYDRAILRLDDQQRSRVAVEWDSVVARAVASGVAAFDDRGRLRLVAR